MPKTSPQPIRDQASDRSRETLAARLENYPPFPLPHAGPIERLTDSQARENFAAFLEARPQRLAAVLALLRAEGVQTGFEGRTGFDPSTVAERLFRWGLRRWGTLRPSQPMPGRGGWTLHTAQTASTR